LRPSAPTSSPESPLKPGLSGLLRPLARQTKRLLWKTRNLRILNEKPLDRSARQV
jgi:hypothetical protein